MVIAREAVGGGTQISAFDPDVVDLVQRTVRTAPSTV
jgi:hypothetical protein